jgi:hypothetical protein
MIQFLVFSFISRDLPCTSITGHTRIDGKIVVAEVKKSSSPDPVSLRHSPMDPLQATNIQLIPALYKQTSSSSPFASNLPNCPSAFYTQLISQDLNVLWPSARPNTHNTLRNNHHASRRPRPHVQQILLHRGLAKQAHGQEARRQLRCRRKSAPSNHTPVS